MKNRSSLLIIFVIITGMVPCAYSQLDIEQYKKQNRNQIANIVDGKHKEARAHFLSYLQEHPGDLESMYGLVVVYAQMAEPDSAMYYLDMALNNGLPFERILAGPRDLINPLTTYEPFQELKEKLDIEWLHGPMLGNVTDRSASFWVRTANTVPVQIVVTGPDGETFQSNVSHTEPARDYTAVVTVNGLLPEQEYQYYVEIDGQSQDLAWSFKTLPPQGYPAKFEIGFGGGSGYTPPYERMWNTIVSHKLRAFLLLGDNVYIDHPKYRQIQQYCYYRRQARPEFRQFIATTSVYAIWDDHDFTKNDGHGGPSIEDPPWKRDVWNTFKNNWINPYYGGGEQQPGCWFDFAIGDVDFIMLDGRYYRMDPYNKQIDKKSMLGDAQKQWLLGRLKSSNATFKVLCSPVPWAPEAKPGYKDTWDGFPDEREEIFSFIEQNKIEGVVLLSADRHRSDAWRISRDEGYDFFEFESSRLTNVHRHKVLPQALFGYRDKCSFGKLTFDTIAPEPFVTYSIYSIDNELIHRIRVTLDQLSF
jgi:alkaline phosphatase D